MNKLFIICANPPAQGIWENKFSLEQMPAKLPIVLFITYNVMVLFYIQN